MLTQRAMGHGVEGASGDPAGAVAGAGQSRVAALDHLPRRSAGEGEQEHPLRRDPVGDDACHPGTQGRRLAGSGAREHAKWSTVEGGDGALLLVETFQQVVHAFEHSAVG